jgi:hypothetical protein
MSLCEGNSTSLSENVIFIYKYLDYIYILSHAYVVANNNNGFGLDGWIY